MSVLDQPWHVKHDSNGSFYIADPKGFPVLLPEDDEAETEVLLKSVVEQHNAGLVMMRRGWHAALLADKSWGVWIPSHRKYFPATTPSAALVEADAWMTAQEKPHAT